MASFYTYEIMSQLNLSHMTAKEFRRSEETVTTTASTTKEGVVYLASYLAHTRTWHIITGIKNSK